MSEQREANERHRVVVVGGGFGGLLATRLLGHMPVDVTLVDRRNYHLFQPLLYQVATGMLSPGQIAPPIRHVVRKYRNVRVEAAEVTGFDLDRRVVHATSAGRLDALELPYDSLIVAAGVNQSYFGHDELARFAPGMKTIDDALELRRRIFGAFEMAEIAVDDADRAHWLTMVVVGAGPTGVELAGQIRELATRCLKGEYRSFDPSAVRVVLVDGGKEPLATFGDQLSEVATRDLTRLGVELRMGAEGGRGGHGRGRRDRRRRHDVAHRGQHDGLGRRRRRPRRSGPLLAKATGAALDRAGRISVLPDLTLPGHPEVFAVGDMASLDKLPGVAEVAMQGGLHAANTIVASPQGGAGAALPLPRPRQRGDDRPLPCRRQHPEGPGERLPRLAGVVLRAPRLPHRLRRPALDDAALAALDGRAGPGRAGVQHRPHRWRPEPPCRRCGPSSSRTPSRNVPTVDSSADQENE